jgi:hypothetical protein
VSLEKTKTVKEAVMNQQAVLDHQFLVAAYTVTWVIQLGYVAWLAVRWRAQKRAAKRVKQNSA